MYRGIGVDTNDPFENFRKNRAGVFIQKLKDRDENLQKAKKGKDAAPFTFRSKKLLVLQFCGEVRGCFCFVVLNRWIPFSMLKPGFHTCVSRTHKGARCLTMYGHQ